MDDPSSSAPYNDESIVARTTGSVETADLHPNFVRASCLKLHKPAICIGLLCDEYLNLLDICGGQAARVRSDNLEWRSASAECNHRE